jgi:lysozyme
MNMAINKPVAIDLYHGDDVLDVPTLLAGLDQVKAAGIFILQHKASEGTTMVDARYAARRAKWMSGGLITVTDLDGTVLQLKPRFAAYHFFHGVDPVAEANHFLSVADLGPGDDAVLDWENVGASGYAPTSDEANAFCDVVEAKLGFAICVYGGNVPSERLSINDVRWKQRRLWGCAYGPRFTMPAAPFSTAGFPWMWQDDGNRYGPGPHIVPGIKGLCDNSTVVAPMTVKCLNAEWAGGTAMAA